MSEQPRTGESRPELEKGGESIGTAAAAKLSSCGAADVSTVVDPAAPKKLTTEEQMALYKKSLKEEDWGHQPC